MGTAPLQCEELWEEQHVRPCVISLACWWREIRELEELLGYERSSLRARDAWDELLAAEILAPREALYIELRDCVNTWRQIARRRGIVYPSLLERLFAISELERLPLPQYGVLAAFRLRQQLCGLTSARRGPAITTPCPAPCRPCQ